MTGLGSLPKALQPRLLLGLLGEVVTSGPNCRVALDMAGRTFSINLSPGACEAVGKSPAAKPRSTG